MRTYYVYILASDTRILYTGVTNNLLRRLAEHRLLRPGSFSGDHQATRLVFFEQGSDVREAIRREKQIKHWSRARRVALIEATNPNWDDLAGDWQVR